jgi:hypothetical protein
VKAQVAAAKEMEDLESRLQGSASSASRQRLGDAAAAIDKERIEVAELKKKEAMEPRLVPKKGTLGKSVRLRTGRVVTEDGRAEGLEDPCE